MARKRRCYQKNSSKSFYSVFAKINKKVREEVSPDPFLSIKNLGPLFKIIAWIFKNIIIMPIHLLIYSLVGLFYIKGEDSPYKGAILYTVFFIVIMTLLTVIVNILI